MGGCNEKSVKLVKMQASFEARRSANLVQVANRYESKIYLEHGDSRVNAKSIMGMMSLALLNSEEDSCGCRGADEAEAVAAIEEFLVS